ADGIGTPGPALALKKSVKAARGISAVAFICFSATLVAQTRITPPRNNYAPADDVRLGKQAVAQAEQQLPVLHDDALTAYVGGIGRRLAAAIPAELQHPEFQYSFSVVDVREINAFALPGGP